MLEPVTDPDDVRVGVPAWPLHQEQRVERRFDRVVEQYEPARGQVAVRAARISLR
ncbi:hypothetical protein [Nonomuraea sp. NPDC049400]|uniref:hypothetical protein n=1 Tax=Nonomuraea sp. NPDC049400 TaxID=3364352 RepID=UPI0037BDB76F